jgi:hypothetical protein
LERTLLGKEGYLPTGAADKSEAVSNNEQKVREVFFILL